ncbi:hypothetical protein GCM10010245_12360 [Streptomyces spectabilis]|nr:hypothetical protein GCM10010245_12360 [Streptomyces spectabilis]
MTTRGPAPAAGRHLTPCQVWAKGTATGAATGTVKGTASGHSTTIYRSQPGRPQELRARERPVRRHPGDSDTVTTPSTPRPAVAFIPPSCCGAGYFRRLRRELGDRVTFHALELPGHGRRYQETPLTDATAAVADLAARIDTPLDALYGESLGAYLALGVADVLKQERPPLLLAASNSPPSVRDRIDLEGLDSIESAVAALRAMGGEIPPEVLSDPELAAGAYPLMRADLHLGQSCIDLVRGSAAAGNLTVFAGADDTALTRLESWAAHTRGRCDVTPLPGGHLLSATNPAGVAERVLEALARG